MAERRTREMESNSKVGQANENADDQVSKVYQLRGLLQRW